MPVAVVVVVVLVVVLKIDSWKVLVLWNWAANPYKMPAASTTTPKKGGGTLIHPHNTTLRLSGERRGENKEF